MDRTEEILTQLTKIRENQLDIDKKLALHVQHTLFELRNIGALDEQQNKLIDQHIEGVKSVKDLIIAHEAAFNLRIQRVEEPIKTFLVLRKWILGLSGLMAAVAVIARILGII